MAKNWIKGAIKHPGAFRAKAKAAGMSTPAYAIKVTAPGSTASTTTKRQANLAKTLGKMNPSRKAAAPKPRAPKPSARPPKPKVRRK